MIESRSYRPPHSSSGMYGHGSASASSRMAGRQEILARERNMVAAGVRPPRRAQSTNDYVYPTPPPSFFSGRPEPGPPPSFSSSSSTSPSSPTSLTSPPASAPAPTPQRPPTIREGVPFSVRPEPTPEQEHSVDMRAGTEQPGSTSTGPGGGQEGLPHRPKIGAPRRSYSVMDYEPVPPTHRPSANLALDDLPPELHYAIFDCLDPIDSTCLGLTNKHFYAIHRRLHGTVPLSVRRAGPNDMEWVWHLASRTGITGSLPHAEGGRDKGGAAATAGTADPPPPRPPSTRKPAAETAMLTSALAQLRVRGQALCRKCGVRRCELHTHIQGWMGPGYEYCTVRDKFGPPAPAGAKEFCYLSNPKDPHRCGRHRVDRHKLQRSATAPASS